MKMANKKRLIDANALMDAFRSYMAERYDRERCVSEENCKTCAGSCLWRKIVSAAPTVDAVEVVHASWIHASNKPGVWIGMKCSLCGARIRYTEFINGNHNYCHKCGAKMDGGNEDV